MRKLKDTLASIFGPAVALRLTGCVVLIAWALNTFPSLMGILGLPEEFKRELLSFCFYLAGGAQLAPFFLAKGKNVTGGTKPITPEAAIRVEEDIANTAEP
jgi:hypothetical protein